MSLSVRLPYSLMLTQWSQKINPLLKNPLSSSLILQNISLVSGSNQVSHLLGRKQQGWFLTDIQGVATIYRSGDFNDKILYLTSDADVTVNIGVF